jgi:hypothetical protein
VVAVGLVVDGVAGLVALLVGYLLGRFHEARRTGTTARHVRVRLDVDRGDDDGHNETTGRRDRGR